MIQFNLLPDVKLEYIRAKRLKRMIMLVSAAVSIVSLVVLILLFSAVNVIQKRYITDLNHDVTTESTKLKNTPDLAKILTVQNQLNNLTDLHDKKPVATRLFGYIGQITPAQVSISKLDIDYKASTINLSGSADSIKTINTFIDTIKFTTYTVGESTETKKAFSEVVLSNFAKSDKAATYEISLKFDPLIFDSKTDAKLVVPKQITTRSETEKPTDLFQANQENQ